MTTNVLLQRLGDAELLSATASLVKRSNAVTSDLLLHLGEVDARKLYLERAHPSMFAFCVGDLGLSEDATCNLLTVARVARRLPAVLEAHREGHVHLTGLRILAPHLTEENVASVLGEATGKSKRDVEVIAARLAPRPPVPDSIRRLPQPPAVGERTLASTTPSLFGATPASSAMRDAGLASADASPSPVAEPDSRQNAPPAWHAAPPVRRTAVAPLSGETFKVQFTADRALRDKLLEAQGLLRHSLPAGELSAVIERALDCLIADVKNKRFGVGSKPRAKCATEEARPAHQTAEAASRHVPVNIRREVFLRDGGRCTFVDSSGRRCAERGGLELDHVDGFARTHTHSVDGLRLRCGPHNQHAADLLYGREFMDAARHRQSSAPGRIDLQPASAPGRRAPGRASAPGRIERQPGIRAGADGRRPSSCAGADRTTAEHPRRGG